MTVVEWGASSDSAAWVSAAAALFGAVLGAVIGGVISYALQKREHDRLAQLRVADRRAQYRATGYALLVKIIIILSDLRRLSEHLTMQLAGHEIGEAWQFVLPLYVEADRIELDRSDIELLFDLGLVEQFNLIGSLPALRNQAHSTMLAYKKKRESLWATIPATAFRAGGVALTEQQLHHTAHLRQEMTDLIRWMQSSVPRAAAEARTALSALNEDLERHLGVAISLEFDDDPPR